MRDEQYADNLQRARRKDDILREDHFWPFLGGEMVGSLAAPGGLYMAGASGVKSGAMMGGSLGALYGVGAGAGPTVQAGGELMGFDPRGDMNSKLIEGALSGAIGAGLGAAIPGLGIGASALKRRLVDRYRDKLERMAE